MNLCRFAVLTTLATLTVTGIPPALAQTLDSSSAPTRPTQQSYTLIHVNPLAGSDSSGDGTQLRPYQTISYALSAAPTNAIVLLAPGEYSEASGERFPIRLRSGITVQGAPGVGPVVIRGSGPFDSVTGGLVHTTLVAADGAGLGNVMVTNPSTAGYGLVIEMGRPVIRQNQFSHNGYGGVYVTGQSTPLIEGNYFFGNGVVGLAIAGQSAAEVQGNRFEQTGIGIRVAPGAQPNISNNTIVQNQEGILLDGSAQPRLSNNVIAQNRRNGVIEFQTAAKAEDSSEGMTTAIAAPAALQPLDFSTAVDVSAINAPSAIASAPRDLPPPPARPVATAPPLPQSEAIPQPPVMAAPAAPQASRPVPEVVDPASEPQVIAERAEPIATAAVLAEEPPVSATLVSPEPDVTMPAVAETAATVPAATVPDVTVPAVMVPDVTAPDGTAPAVAGTALVGADTPAIAAEAQSSAALATLDADSLPLLPDLPPNLPTVAATEAVSPAPPEPSPSAIPNAASPEPVAIAVAPSPDLSTTPPPAATATPEVTRPSEAAPTADEAAAMDERLRRIRAAANERIAASQAVLNRTAPAAPSSGANSRAQERAQEAAAVHEHLRRIRAAANGGTVAHSPTSDHSPVASSAAPGVSETSAAGIPIAVIPPPSNALASVTPNVTPSVTPPPTASPVVAAAPAQPIPASSSPQEVALLQVPGGNIPLGRGGSSVPNLPPPQAGTLSDGTMPPPPPSHASMLGLVYKVFVPAVDANTQARVRAIVSDAFRVNVNGQPMMQAGAYADQAAAEARAAELIAQGIAARVEYRP